MSDPEIRHAMQLIGIEVERANSLFPNDESVVSGMKSDRIFYRKAVIACGGKIWHHIAFEYPADRKRAMDAFVIRAATSIDHAENHGCEEATSSFNPPIVENAVMSALGAPQKPTCAPRKVMSALPPKADIGAAHINVG